MFQKQCPVQWMPSSNRSVTLNVKRKETSSREGQAGSVTACQYLSQEQRVLPFGPESFVFPFAIQCHNEQNTVIFFVCVCVWVCVCVCVCVCVKFGLSR